MRRHLGTIIDRYRPDLIHTNHIWLVSALLPDLAPGIPLTATCHATGLRQMDLCPHLRDEVVAGCRRIDRFCVLRHDHREQLADTLAIDADRVTVTGVGFQEEVFFQGDSAGNKERRGSLLYVGKYSNAKGLPWLLDAVEKLAVRRPNLRLHVAGSGAGAEADGLRERMDALAPLVIRHGQLGQEDLAALMRRCAVCVLPSFYEGVPLVLVEAAACGCRLVSTALPGVVEQIVPGFGAELALVPLPRLRNVDRPVAADLPRFTAALGQALALSLDRTEKASTLDLGPFTWGAVFKRVEAVWKQLL